MINRHAVARSKVDIISRIMFINILVKYTGSDAYECNADDQIFNSDFSIRRFKEMIDILCHRYMIRLNS